MLASLEHNAIFSRKVALNYATLCKVSQKTQSKSSKLNRHALRRLATHSEPLAESDIPEGIYDAPTPLSGYTSRHVISIFPTLPVLDKLRELQEKLGARTRMVPVPRTSFQIALVPLGTSLSEPGKLDQVKKIMDKIAHQTKPIAIEIGGIGCIPKWSKPREVFAGLTIGKDQVKLMIKQLEQELEEAQFLINEPGAVRHRTKIPLGIWEDVYVTSLQGDLAKEVSDSVGQYAQASFLAHQIVLLEQKPDTDVVPIHVSLLGGILPARKRARYKTLL